MSSIPPSNKTVSVKSVFSALLGLLILVALAGLIIIGFVQLWRSLAGINPALATAAATIIAAALTVTVGRYFERRKEIEAAYRDKKTAIYDEFLVGLFRMLLGGEEGSVSVNQEADPAVVEFLREHHRKLILWSGPKGLKAYSDWYKQMQLTSVSAQTVLKMEKFFLALRADLGHSNRGLKDGDILRLILKDTDLLLLASKTNPNITWG